jgi:hypothetical protein
MLMFRFGCIRSDRIFIGWNITSMGQPIGIPNNRNIGRRHAMMILANLILANGRGSARIYFSFYILLI